MLKASRKQLAVGAVAAAVTLFGAVRRFGDWQRHWGATDDELLRILPGDGRVPDPVYVTTRAITVDAEPRDIFPWLVQMGKGRGGLYSYDFLDRLFGILDAPSAKVILPEFQDLQPGDEIPVGKGGNFPVADLRRDEFLLLAGEADGAAWTWSTALYPMAGGKTRIVTRNTGRGGPFDRRMLMGIVDIAAFIMVRRWLKVLKQRGEWLHGKRLAEVEVEGVVAEAP
ncbi:MAG: SRPBCC family protein [Dehalococcoidia bacterium]